MRAIPFDLERHCRVASAQGTVVGCRPHSETKTLDAPCVVRQADGALFTALSSAGFQQTGWQTCSSEQVAQVSPYPDCP